MIAKTAFLALALGTAGCVTPPIHPIDVNAIGAVQANIKKQLGVYLATVQNLPTQVAGKPEDGPVVLINDTAVRIPKSEFICGSGAINFKVSTVKAELTTTLDSTSGVKFGLSIPLTGITLGPSIGQTKESVNAQTLDYNLWPLGPDDQDQAVTQSMPTTDDFAKAPIAKALLDLRNALILSATKTDYFAHPTVQRPPQPCFTDYDPSNPTKDAGNSFKLALNVTSDATAGLNVTVAPLTFGATGESKSTTGNTLTVAFVQRGLKGVQLLSDQATKLCSFPNDTKTSPLCAIATQALAVATAQTSTVPAKLAALDAAADKQCLTSKSDCPTTNKLKMIAHKIGEDPGIGAELLLD